jgi:hypothetical protein
VSLGEQLRRFQRTVILSLSEDKALQSFKMSGIIYTSQHHIPEDMYCCEILKSRDIHYTFLEI